MLEMLGREFLKLSGAIALSIFLMVLSPYSMANSVAKNCENNLVGAVKLLPPDIIQTLRVAAEAFCEVQAEGRKTHYQVRVTGSARSISDQARYISLCLKRDGCKIYENQEAVREYKAMENVTQKTIQGKITDQLKRNCFISKHLSNRAVDVGTRGMPKRLVNLLAQLIGDTEYHFEGKKYQPDVINRSHGTGPHLHINFKPYYFDPSKCPKEYSFQTN